MRQIRSRNEWIGNYFASRHPYLYHHSPIVSEALHRTAPVPGPNLHGLLSTDYPFHVSSQHAQAVVPPFAQPAYHHQGMHTPPPRSPFGSYVTPLNPAVMLRQHPMSSVPVANYSTSGAMHSGTTTTAAGPGGPFPHHFQFPIAPASAPPPAPPVAPPMVSSPHISMNGVPLGRFPPMDHPHLEPFGGSGRASKRSRE